MYNLQSGRIFDRIQCTESNNKSAKYPASSVLNADAKLSFCSHPTSFGKVLPSSFFNAENTKH